MMSSGSNYRTQLSGYRTLIGRLLLRVTARTEFRRVQPGLNFSPIEIGEGGSDKYLLNKMDK